MGAPKARPHGWKPMAPPDRRGYGSDHKKIRRQLLEEEPYCRECIRQNRLTPSTVADHIQPKCLGGKTERANYQALCLPCSRSKTGREGAFVRWHVRRRGAASSSSRSSSGPGLVANSRINNSVYRGNK